MCCATLPRQTGTPARVGRSKLAAKVERLLGVPTTARNWRTVQRILAPVADDGG